MAGNEVTLTIAGDASSATRALGQTEQAADSTARAFDNVGSSAQQMATRVGDSESAFDQAARQAGGMAEKFDTASGASSTLAGGLGDVGGALAEIGGEGSQLAAIGEGMEKAGAIVQGFTGLMDLAKLATMGSTVAQWALNSAFLASPITWIVLGIIALIAVIVLIATKTTWFQDLWRAVWGFIKDAAKAVGDWFTETLWPGIKAVFDFIVDYVMFVKDMYVKAFDLVVDAGKGLIGWFKKLPELLGQAFGKVFDIVSKPFKEAFNFVAKLWNNTIGSLSLSVPDWVPGIGGKSFSVKKIPTFHSGGVVQGAPGQEVLALLQAGETVTPAGAGNRVVIEIRSGGTADDDFLVEKLSRAVRARGGDVQLVLGGIRG